MGETIVQCDSVVLRGATWRYFPVLNLEEVICLDSNSFVNSLEMKI